MTQWLASGRSIVVKTMVTHTVTYFVAGFYLLWETFFARHNGWVLMWMVLVSCGILGTFGAPPGSLEGFIYSVVPRSVQLILLPEVLVQSLLLSWLVFQWVNHPEKRWLPWTMGAAFFVVLLLPTLGLVVGARR